MLSVIKPIPVFESVEIGDGVQRTDLGPGTCMPLPPLHGLLVAWTVGRWRGCSTRFHLHCFVDTSDVLGGIPAGFAAFALRGSMASSLAMLAVLAVGPDSAAATTEKPVSGGKAQQPAGRHKVAADASTGLGVRRVLSYSQSVPFVLCVFLPSRLSVCPSVPLVSWLFSGFCCVLSPSASCAPVLRMPRNLICQYRMSIHASAPLSRLPSSFPTWLLTSFLCLAGEEPVRAVPAMKRGWQD
jgi:hypothetical protein